MADPDENGDTVPAKSKKRRWLKPAIILGLVLLAGGWFTVRWLGERLAEYVQVQLEQKGVHIDWDRAEWTTGPGVRLKNLRVSDHADRTQTLAWWSSVTLRRGAEGWTSASLHCKDAQLRLGDEEKGMALNAVSLDATGNREGLVLERLDAEIQGLLLEAQARLKWEALLNPAKSPPADPTRPKKDESWRAYAEVLAPVVKILREWVNFQGSADPPRLKLTANAVSRESGLNLALTFDGADIMWRGQHAGGMAFSADMTVIDGKPGPVRFSRLTRDPGSGTDRFLATLDLKTMVLQVEEADTALDVLKLVRASLGRGSLLNMGIDESPGLLRISGKGKIPLNEPARMEWKGAAAAPLGLVVQLPEGRSLQLGPVTMQVQAADGGLTLQQVSIPVWNGMLTLPKATLRLAGAPKFTASLQASQLHLSDMLASLGGDASRQGRFDLDWNGGGGFDLASLNGQGTVAVNDAAFYTLPLLGPLSVVLGKVAPGFAKDTASTLTGRYALKSGMLRLDDVAVKSAITQITAEGDVDLVRKHAQMTGKANLSGIVGLSTALLSELLAVEGEGPLNDMKWRLKHVPGIGAAVGAVGAVGGAALDVTKGVGGVALDVTKGVGGAALDVTKGAGGVAGDAAKGVLEGTGKAAGGLLKLPGKLLPKFGKDKE